MPDVGLTTFEDFETGEAVLVDTSNARVRAHYARAMKEQRESHIRTFRKHGLDHCIVRTDKPFVEPLRQLFARRAKRIRR
jgi:hypothetical protein